MVPAKMHVDDYIKNCCSTGIKKASRYNGARDALLTLK